MGRKAFFGVLIAAVVVKTALALWIPLTPDEGLHWMQGRHLALGFADHPPGTAFLNWLGGHMFGASVFSVRFFPIVSTLACSAIGYLILKETGHSDGSARAGSAALQAVPMVAFGIVMVPVVPFLSLIMAAEYFFVRALGRRRLADHLLWGLFLGLSITTYYIAAVAVLAAGLFCVSGGRWKILMSDGGFWAGVALAGLMAAPNLWWNACRGGDSAVAFQLFQRSPYAFNLIYPLSFILLCVLLAGPIIVPAIVMAVRGLAGRSGTGDDQRQRLFAFFVVVPVGAFLLMSFVRECGAHWAALAFVNAPLLLVQKEKTFPAGLKKWFVGNTVLSLAIAVFSLTVLAAGVGNCARVLGVEKKLAGSRKTRLFFGAPEAGRAALRLRGSLFAREGGISLAADKWTSAGLLSFYTPGNPYYAVVPEPSRHGRDYRRWNAAAPPAPAVILASSRPSLRKSTASAFASSMFLEEAGGYHFYLVFPKHTASQIH